MSKRNDAEWLDNLELLKEYISQNNKMPSSSVIYKNVKIGYWLNNQRTSYKNGELSQDRKDALDAVNKYWNGTKNDILEENKRLLINSNWKSRVPSGNHPIDILFKDDKLYLYLSKEIYDCETYYEYCATKTDMMNCLNVIIHQFNYPYSRLLFDIYSINIRTETVSEIKEFYNSTAVKDPEDLKNRILKMFDIALTAREMTVLDLIYGLGLTESVEVKERTLLDVGKLINISEERIRQIKSKALRKLYCPSSINILYQYGTIADEFYNKNDRKILYDLGVDSIEKMYELLESNLINDGLKEKVYNFLNPLEQEKKKFLSSPIDNLGLSIRSCNALRRRVKTVGELIELCNDGDEIYRTRNLGKISVEEVKEKLAKILEEKKELGIVSPFVKSNLAPEEDLMKKQNLSIYDNICKLELSVRSLNALYRAGINNINDLIKLLKSDDIFKVRNLGKISIEQIDIQLQKFII